MEIISSIKDMQNRSIMQGQNRQRIGLVPTMGALHEGHFSLIRKCRDVCDIVVVSIFVNPTQFGPNEDFAKYPRTFDKDCAAVEGLGGDIVFAPRSEEMYPEGFRTFAHVEGLTEGLCGAGRPGHFRGVTTVVLKLLNIVRPVLAVFGQKDAQQAIVLKRMVEDLNIPTKLLIAPVVREPDGLAMSSRNVYLTEEERAQAPSIFGALRDAREKYEKGERSGPKLKSAITERLSSVPLLKVEYVEVVTAGTLKSADQVETPTLCAVACRTVQSSTRLIDNIIIGGHL